MKVRSFLLGMLVGAVLTAAGFFLFADQIRGAVATKAQGLGHKVRTVGEKIQKTGEKMR